jgi:hypothetical protein
VLLRGLLGRRFRDEGFLLFLGLTICLYRVFFYLFEYDAYYWGDWHKESKGGT